MSIYCVKQPLFGRKNYCFISTKALQGNEKRSLCPDITFHNKAKPLPVHVIIFRFTSRQVSNELAFLTLAIKIYLKLTLAKQIILTT